MSMKIQVEPKAIGSRKKRPAQTCIQSSLQFLLVLTSAPNHMNAPDISTNLIPCKSNTRETLSIQHESYTSQVCQFESLKLQPVQGLRVILVFKKWVLSCNQHQPHGQQYRHNHQQSTNITIDKPVWNS